MPKHKPPKHLAPASQQQTGGEINHPKGAEVPKGTPHEPRANDDKWHAEERKNWTRQSRPQWALVGISFLGVIAAVSTLLILKSTLDATKQAADAATAQSKTSNEDMKRSHRPWASVAGEEVATVKPLSFNTDRTKAQGWISYKIKNSGSSPAINAVALTALIVDPSQTLLAGAQKISPCDPNFIEQATKIVGLFVPPGDVIAAPVTEIHTVLPFPKSGPISALLQLCVGYKDEFNIPHGTGSTWKYFTEDGKESFDPKGVIQGHWAFFGIGNAVY